MTTGMVCIRIIALQHISTIRSTSLHEHEAVHEVSTQILEIFYVRWIFPLPGTRGDGVEPIDEEIP